MRILRLLPAPVVLLAACAGLGGRTPPPASLTVIVRGEGVDTLRAQGPVFPRPVPTFHRLPSADGSLGYEGLSSSARADSGLVLMLEESGFDVPLMVTDVPLNPLDAEGLPHGAPDTLRARAGDKCESVVPFVLPGAAPLPRGRVYVSVTQDEGDLLLHVDPRRDAWKARPVLHFRTDTLRVAGRDRRRRVEAGTAAADTNVLVIAVGITPGHPPDVVAWPGGEPMSFDIASDPAVRQEWGFYLFDDRPQLRSPCRGPPDRPVSEESFAEEQARSYADALDSTLARAGVPAMDPLRLRGSDREIRVTTTVGWPPHPEHALRVWVRHGRAGGELFVISPWAADARECHEPNSTQDWRACRVEPRAPVDWRRVMARLDSLEAWTLPPQPSGGMPYITDMGSVTVSTRVGRTRSAAYYYGPGVQDRPEARRADGIAALLSAIVNGEFGAPAGTAPER